MALSFGDIEQHSQGDLRAVSTSVTFDASYASGGESLSPQQLGLGQFVGPLEFQSSEDGYTFEWDASNSKIKVLATSSIPQLIVNESVTMAANTGTLAYPPAYIISIEESGGGGIVYNIVGQGKVAVDNVSVAVNFLTGVIVNISADAPNPLLVTYFPQRAGTFFSLENLVIDESIVPSASKVNLTFRAAAIQYIAGDTTPIAFTYETIGDGPGAGTVVVDFDDSSETSIDFNSTDVSSEATCSVTYLKHSGLGKEAALLQETERTLGSEAFSWLSDSFADAPFGDDALAVPALGTRWNGEESGDTTHIGTWTGYTDTDGPAIATANMRTRVFTTDDSTAVTKSTMQWLKVQTGIGGGGLVEINSGADLSSVTIKVYARGR